MARRGTLDHGFDDDRGGNAGLANVAGYYFDCCASRDPVIGRALGGAGGGPRYIRHRHRRGLRVVAPVAALAVAAISTTATRRCTCAGGHGGAGGYSGYGGAGAVSAEYGNTGKRGTRNSQESETDSYGEPEPHAAVHVVHAAALD